MTRTALVDRLLAAPAAPVICVVAPAGYGKTTLLAQWAVRKGQRVGWVTVDPRDDDPAVLLTYLADALDRIEPIDPAVFDALATPGVSVAASVVPRLAAAVAAMTKPVALVLDHVELLSNRQCLDAVAEFASQLPSGSQLALASRVRPSLPVALLRAQGRVVEIGIEELAMGQREAGALLEGAGAQLADADIAGLVVRTEGWPVGLYLAALALRAGTPHGRNVPAFGGDDRLVADYLWSEFLSRLPTRVVSFLMRTVVLDRMSGPLCDAVLETAGAAAMLESLEESNLLVVPLDRQRQWYRYHHLFRDLLRTELERHEPELVGPLHLRAATWYEASGMPEAAIDHAQAAQDADRVARLVASVLQRTYAAGHVDTVLGWLEWFERNGLIGRYPIIAFLGALIYALAGHPASAERWAAAAERGPAVETLPGHTAMESYLAMIHALLCRNGVEQMRADAQAAREGLAPDDTLLGPALLFEGVAHLLNGQGDRADAILDHAVEIAIHDRALPAASAALAERALLAIQRGDWSQAETLAGRSLEIVRAGRLDNYPNAALAYAMVARIAARRGDVPRAKEHLARAVRLRPLLTSAIPHFTVQTLLELARAYLALNDASGARTVLRQTQDVLRRQPDLGVLPRQAEELRSKLDTIHVGPMGASSLTTAELRLLPLLSTHLTFREIGERLYISQYTVKSQVGSVYRKLGVTSRGEAVERMQQIGLGV